MRGLLPAKEVLLYMSQSENDVYKGLERGEVAEIVGDVYGEQSGESFRWCGEGAVFVACNDCSSVHSYDKTCDYRFCDRCGGKGMAQMSRYKSLTERIENGKLVTLTIENVDELSGDVIDELRNGFYELRDKLEELSKDEIIELIHSADIQQKKKQRYIADLKRVLFNQRIRGGLYAIEIKNDGNGWNVHMHALVDAEYIAQPVLSTLWDDITGNTIVDIRAASGSSAVRYVLKYVFKPPSVEGYRQFKEYVRVTKGKRLYGTFGELYDFSPEDETAVCPICGSEALEWIGSTSGNPAETSLTHTRPPPMIPPPQSRLSAHS